MPPPEDHLTPAPNGIMIRSSKAYPRRKQCIVADIHAALHLWACWSALPRITTHFTPTSGSWLTSSRCSVSSAAQVFAAVSSQRRRPLLDVVRHPKMFNTELRGSNEGPIILDRWTVDLTAGKVLETRLDVHSTNSRVSTNDSWADRTAPATPYKPHPAPEPSPSTPC